MRRDESGAAWETVFDVVSLGASITEVVANPANVWAWAGLAGDIADVAIPFIGGIGETIKCCGAVNKADNIIDVAKKSGSNPKNVFPDNPDDLLPEIPRNKVTKANGTTSQTIQTSDNIRIRAEQHPLLPGETYNPRHHGVHYHVEYKVDPAKSWNNKNNVNKWYPDGYTPGAGSGFIPGEPLPK